MLVAIARRWRHPSGASSPSFQVSEGEWTLWVKYPAARSSVDRTSTRTSTGLERLESVACCCREARRSEGSKDGSVYSRSTRSGIVSAVRPDPRRRRRFCIGHYGGS